MSREAALIGVLVFAVVALMGLSAAYQTTVEESQPLTQIDNESFSFANGTLIALDESRRDVVYNDSATVYQNGTEWDDDGNYTWFAGNGTLFITATTGLNASEPATLTYAYWVPSGVQKATRDIALVPFGLGAELGLIVGAVLALTALVVLGRQR